MNAFHWNTIPKPHHSGGFTLLEALVTVVVISIGLLGILGLQTVSIANTQISAARSIATVAADNMADRIRANPMGEADGGYEGISHPAAGSKPKDCTRKSCTTGELAAFDAWEWDTAIGEQLPEGEGHVACEAAAGSDCQIYRITVVWHEREPKATAGTAPAQCDDSAFDNRCFATLVRP